MEVVALRRVLLLINPASRGGARLEPRATQAFAQAGVICESRRTTHPGHAAALAAQVGGDYDAVFTLGGDGTVMEVLGALAESNTPIGILPGGTGNLVARALSIPMSVSRAVTVLSAGSTRRVDLGRLGDGRVFAFAAGVGIDATMVGQTTAAAKRRFGVAAYLATALRASLALDAFTLRATVDGVPHRFRATAAVVANFGSVLHGLLHLGPAISENDGMLDLCVFSPANVGDALRIGWRMARNDFGTDSAMQFVRGRHISHDTEPARAAQADGELLGSTPLDIEVVPAAALLLVPSGDLLHT